MLVCMLQKAGKEGKITGLTVAKGTPSVSHLLFADDSIFYCREKDEEFQCLLSILDEYSIASGQRINYQKSSIYFGKRILQDRKSEIKQLTGINEEGGYSFYLGLPEAFGGSKITILGYLKERLQQKFSGWQANFLSSGGKEILLKAVAMALPTYTMSCFMLPKAVCQQLASLMADFWWRNKRDSRGMHWKAWDQLSKQKNEGGLGFKGIETFNIALLGKQLWRMITCPSTMMARVFRSRYFSKTDPLQAKLGSRPSYAWRSIFAAQELIKKGARMVIGDGKSTDIWQTQWLHSKSARSLQQVRQIPQHLRSNVSSLTKVNDLLRDNGREWRRDILGEIFLEEV
ncbi:PREDICTED: uncharacterized protein LOC109127263 [Camelina sativa]|uniref:Uncharacterized protein LOC109127263 n=1 Tax=Camelina sativa TaxID=90675 RepID=A0ABM1QKU1_CAMSA|nr:PREDICTED: uncharacterized protein LOC109127263 [Camelina sativa]